MALRTLTSGDELLAVTGHHPFVRGRVPHGEAEKWMWALGSAACWVGLDAEERRAYVHVLGTPADVTAILDAASPALLTELPQPARLTAPRGTVLPPTLAVPDSDDWEFRWTTAGGLVDTSAVRWVTDLDEIDAFLDIHSPHASARARDPHVRRWCGVGEDPLLAVAADTTSVVGVGHISSVATHLERRGEGLGGAVTAYLVDALLSEGHDVVTLGLYASNATARRLYERIGFDGVLELTSGVLQAP